MSGSYPRLSLAVTVALGGESLSAGDSKRRGCFGLTAQLCKGCDPYGQLLCGMLQVPGAVQTLHTHSMAAHGHSIGAYNTPVTTQ